MQWLDYQSAFVVCCMTKRKHGIMVQFDSEIDWPSLQKACSFLDLQLHAQIIHDGIGFFFFNTLEQMETAKTSIDTNLVSFVTADPYGRFLDEGH